MTFTIFKAFESYRPIPMGTRIRALVRGSMMKFFSIVAAAAVQAVACLATDFAHAAPAASMAWVSRSGIDSDGCGALAAPCRTFQYAHDNIVAAGGQIRVRDASGFSPLVIRKSISIINDGAGLAGIANTASNGIAIDIQAGVNDVVLLKGLTLNGGGTGYYGIKVTSAGSVTIAKCVVKAFGTYGIYAAPYNDLKLDISDSIFSSGSNGMLFGGVARGKVYATLTRVDVSGNSSNGLWLNVNTTVYANQVSSSFNNGTAIVEYGTLYLTNSNIVGNNFGIVFMTRASTVNTFGNNVIEANTGADVYDGSLSTSTGFN
jgi:hypothetical protein